MTISGFARRPGAAAATAPRARRHRSGAALVLVAVVAFASTVLGVTRGSAVAAADPIATPVQHAYVVLASDSSGTYSFAESDEALLARIDASLARWVVESDHLITSFTREGPPVKIALDCTQPRFHNRIWDMSAMLFPGVEFGGISGNHMMVVGPKGCQSGYGTVGSAANGLSNGGKTYNDDTVEKGTSTFLHELGHNFGLAHAHGVICDPACSVADYGDDYEFMGPTVYTTPPQVPPSLGSFGRTFLRIPSDACEIPSVALPAGQQTVSATYDLYGRGTDSGTRGLKVVTPAGATYYFDYRNRVGRDAGAYYGSALDSYQSETYNTGVTVDLLQPDGTAIIGQNHPKPDPSKGYFYGWNSGESYTANGMVMHVDSTNTSKALDSTAQITVTLTDPAAGGAAPLPDQAGTATVGGDAAVGSTLTATPTGWTPGACYRYQWYQDGVAIAGARSQTYIVPASADGHLLSVAITGQQTGYQPLTATSPSLAVGADTTPPQTTIDSGATPGSTETKPTFTFRADETSTFECSVDNSAYAACRSPYTTTALAPGDHTFAVRATDVAGNVDPTPATQAFTIAAVVPPETTLLSGAVAVSDDSSPTFTFTANEPATFQCKIDDAVYTTCTSPFTSDALTRGAHTFTVRAVDLAGVADPTPATQDFTIAAFEAPVALDDTATTTAGQAVTVDVLTNDTAVGGASLDPTSVTFGIKAEGGGRPLHVLAAAAAAAQPPGSTVPLDGKSIDVPGQVAMGIGASGLITATPVAGFTGTTDPVTYHVFDTNGLTASATLTITVEEAPTTSPAAPPTSPGGTTTSPGGSTTSSGGGRSPAGSGSPVGSSTLSGAHSVGGLGSQDSDGESDGGLSDTGIPTGTYLAIALTLILLGSLFIFATRRRPSRH